MTFPIDTFIPNDFNLNQINSYFFFLNSVDMEHIKYTILTTIEHISIHSYWEIIATLSFNVANRKLNS